MNQEFKRGDLVQVRDRDDKDWRDAVYIAYVPQMKHPHTVFFPNAILPSSLKFCRAIPAATDHEMAMLTDVELTETIETKLNNAIDVMNGAIAHLNAEINKLKKQIQ